MRPKQLIWPEIKRIKSAEAGSVMGEAHPQPASLEKDLSDDIGIHLDKKNEHGENFHCDEDVEVLEERATQERADAAIQTIK